MPIRPRAAAAAIAVAIAVAACSWVTPVGIANHGETPLELTLHAPLSQLRLGGDTMRVVPLERFERGRVRYDTWRPQPLTGVRVDSVAGTVAITIPPRTVAAVAMTMNCRDVESCPWFGIRAIELRGAFGTRMLEGAALRSAFAHQHSTFVLHYR